MIGRAIDDFALRIWIALVRRGGYWKVAELRIEQFPLYPARDLRTRLESLVENGMARRLRAGAEHARYGVTTKCSAPPGYEFLMQPAPTPLSPEGAPVTPRTQL